MELDIIEIIERKRDGGRLSKEEIEFAIQGFLDGSIEDYQMSALLMAICINGMEDQEIIELTKAMWQSGETLDLSFIPGIKVDKHSTGGVGDKTTLVICPLVAACGVPALKMSGRGLGTTGGTLDKLESITGLQVQRSLKDIKKQLINEGIVIVSQMPNLDPADKKIYALRDVTGTANSLPLIAASVMSKKLAAGCDKIVLDVKVGNGAFMKTVEDATELARIMIKIGQACGRETVALLTNMEEPLGYAIGNSLEVVEAISTLRGHGEPKFVDLCIELSAWMVSLGKDIDFEEAKAQVKEALESGAGYEKFKNFVRAQGGSIDKFERAQNRVDVHSTETGYINQIDATLLADIAREMGAGRMTEDDPIDYSVGIVLNKKCGDFVQEGEILGKIFINDEEDYREVFKQAFTIERERKEDEPLIYDVIR